MPFALHAHANPALHGTWSAAVEGKPLTVSFDANGSGKVNGTPMRWQTLGPMLVVEQQGNSTAYGFSVKDGKLNVSGGELPGTVVMSRGTAAADDARAKAPPQPKAATAPQASQAPSGGQELVGKWCQMSTFRANTGGSQRTTCFELRPDGTYAYRYEGSMSGTTGSTASKSSDAGRWKVDGSRLVAQSQRGTVSSYALEKRNHPKNKRDPMICLDGECYLTYYNKPAW